MYKVCISIDEEHNGWSESVDLLVIAEFDNEKDAVRHAKEMRKDELKKLVNGYEPSIVVFCEEEDGEIESIYAR